MADLTVVVLTKNEEKNLRKCVESFCGAAKRFVIVDSGSTDGTETLCSQLDRELRVFGSRLDFYYHPWNSYADQFNWGLKNTQISTEWSMRMDAGARTGDKRETGSAEGTRKRCHSAKTNDLYGKMDSSRRTVS